MQSPPELVCLGIGTLLASAIACRPAIAWLAKFGARQPISADAPERHKAKQGTPTMGGIVIVGVGVVGGLVAAAAQMGSHRNLERDLAWAPVLGITLAYAAIGFTDDLLKTRRGRNLGLRAREKFAAQCVVALLFAFWLAAQARPGLTTFVEVAPPRLAGLGLSSMLDLGVLYFPLAVMFIVGMSNAVNITDGLDGLSGGLAIAVFLAIACLGLSGASGFVPSFAIAMAGAIGGFLWWNVHPAAVMMGDTGSLAIGAALAASALVSKLEVATLVASLVLLAETGSVALQVGTFKWRRRRHGIEYAAAHRLFRRAPLHHHFEECGWPETSIVPRMWIAGAACAALAMLWSRA